MPVFRNALTAAAALCLAAALPLQAQDKTPTPSARKDATGKSAAQLSSEDRNALENLAQADLAEIQAGKLAAQKATNPEVKKFAQHMVQDHTAMLKEGEKIARAHGVKPPTSPGLTHQAKLKILEMKSGQNFDRDYMDQMVSSHEDALELARETARDAKNPALKAHAEKGATKIQEHLAQARKLHETLSASGSDKSGDKASGKGSSSKSSKSPGSKSEK